MKKKIIYTALLLYVLFLSCNSFNKVINYEELALTYFADSISSNLKLPTKETLFYDGLIADYSKHFEDPIEVINTPDYKEILEFDKSNRANKAKDFQIKIPISIKYKLFEEFINENKNDKYFIKVKHYIKSEKKTLVEIDLYGKRGIAKMFYIFFNSNGSIIEWNEADIISPLPHESFVWG